MQIMKYRVTNLKIIFIYERQYHLVSKAECQSDILCNHYVIIAYNVEHNIIFKAMILPSQILFYRKQKLYVYMLYKYYI